MPITKQFIDEWAPQYENTEHDEDEYQKLLIEVPREVLKEEGIISENIFRRVINWKSHRIKGKIEWDNFDKYKKVFSGLDKLNNQNKLISLISLSGVGMPTASVFLHYL